MPAQLMQHPHQQRPAQGTDDGGQHDKTNGAGKALQALHPIDKIW